MVVQTNSKVVEWKKLWQLVSGKHYKTPKSTVRDELSAIKTELLNGIKSNSSATSIIKLEDCPHTLWPFIDKLKQYLDCSKQQTWTIFCCYLQNEYNGSFELLINFLKTETNTMILLNNIWDHQSLERMTQLKILKNHLEFYKSSIHPYANEYEQILNEIDLNKLRKSYIEQFEQLVREPAPFKFTHGELFNVHSKLVSWSERKLREINEILQILLLLVERCNIETTEFKILVELFKLHSFGRQQQYLDVAGNSMHRELITKITYSEVALFMKCIDVNTRSPEPAASWITDVATALDKDIVLLHQSPEHGPLLLSWMLMNFHVIELSEDNDKFRKFRQFGTKAVQLDVFGYLRTMINHPMYRDQSFASTIVCQSIYNQLAFLCDIFDSDRAVSQHKNIYELLSELLKIPIIAKEFCFNAESGARSLLNTAVENFPVDFVPLSMIAHSLSSAGTVFSRYIRGKLEQLTVYTEYYNSQRINLKPSDFNEEEFILTHDFTPFGLKIDYIIPAGTIAVVTDKASGTQVHFKTSLNYFNALHYQINELLFDLIKRPEIDAERKQSVCYGLKYLASAVRRIENPSEISNEMVHPTEMVFDILIKFKDVPNPPIELLAQCFDVCAALVPMHQTEIYKRVINLDILPFCTNDKLHFREYANGVSFDTGLVGYYLVTFEKATGRYEFLSAYLAFLKIFAQSALDFTVSLELPGLIFLLREVFPYIHTWRFENELDRHRITAHILQYFNDILQITDENHSRSILRNTCVYSLLHLDSGMTLLRIVALGNAHIEEIMQNESNWMTAETAGFNFLIQLSMTILTRILRWRNKVIGKLTGSLSPLETVIYTQPKHVIPVVTSYMRNIFNSRLPELSCNLLRRFAIEFQMSLLACLDMEPSQIRSTFLERLENELECDELKIAVLEFVEACINKQPGLTEAFFKITYDDRVLDKQKEIAKNADLGEGILTYMRLYLKVVGKNPNAVAENLGDDSSLLSQIMSLFHSLWKNNMQSLVDKLINEKDFWPSILNPLFGHIEPKIRVYSQLFNMIGLELYRLVDAKNINQNFKQTIERFLDKNVFYDWIDDVLSIPHDSVDLIAADETPDWLCRLQSLKDLFVIILRRKNRHGIKVSSECLEYFTDQCLQRLTERVHCTDDLRPFIVLTELYLTLLLNYSHKYKASTLEDVNVLRQITELLNELSVSYAEMHLRAKESVLAIAFKAIELFPDELNANAEITLNFIESIIRIVCFELSETENAFKANQKTIEIVGGHTERKNLSFILCVNVLKSILNHINGNATSSSVENYLVANRVFNRILSCLHVLLPQHSGRKLSCAMLDILIVFANGKFSSQLLHCDLSDYLWLKLLPPKELLQASCAVTATTASASISNAITWQPHEWWPIYRRGIQLVHTIVEQHGLLFVNDAIAFVGVHEEFLMDSILLAKHALDESPIKLVKSALELVNELIKYEKQWRLEHQQSMINLMRCVQVMLDHVVSLLYRPKILKRLMKDTSATAASAHLTISSDDGDSFEDELTTMNELIHIVTICTKSLMAFSPALLDQLTSSDFIPTKWQPLIEIQFNAPKLNVGVTFPQLTFGTVLNAAVLLTKALNLQQFGFEEIPLNEIDDSTVADESALRHTFSDTLAVSRISHRRRRNYTMSLSILSTTSVSAAPNEYLANLNGELCFTALEVILTLLASQSLLALKDVNLSQREKQLIKRELCTELSVFHDFVKKRILSDESKEEPLRRKKYGIIQMEPCKSYLLRSEDRNDRRSIGQRSSGVSMRVNVTRKLHLTTQQTPSTRPTTSTEFNMTQQFSPISDVGTVSSRSGGSLTSISGRIGIGSSNLPSSTPASLQLKSCMKSTPKPGTKRNSDLYDYQADEYAEKKTISSIELRHNEHDDSVIDEEEEQIFFEPDEPTYCESSFVRLVEEDYLHFLSNLFAYICQTENIN